MYLRLRIFFLPLSMLVNWILKVKGIDDILSLSRQYEEKFKHQSYLKSIIALQWSGQTYELGRGEQKFIIEFSLGYVPFLFPLCKDAASFSRPKKTSRVTDTFSL